MWTSQVSVGELPVFTTQVTPKAAQLLDRSGSWRMAVCWSLIIYIEMIIWITIDMRELMIIYLVLNQQLKFLLLDDEFSV